MSPRITPLRMITLVLAAVHTLPARHHVADFFDTRSLADAWKGFGAAAAVVLLLLPQRVQARIACALWKHRAIAFVIALVHAVPAADHLPKLASSFSFGDAWKGLGAAIAIFWFLAPSARQLDVVRVLALGKRASARFVKVSVALAALAIAFVTACAQNGFDGGNPNGNDASVDGGACSPCVIDTDCASGSVCAQLGGDSYCATTCANQSTCGNGTQCLAVSTVTGDQAQVCVDTSSSTCGLNPSQPGADAGPPPSSCPGLADPNTKASCSSCGQFQQTCQPNGCYGGWWCNEQTSKCQAPPTNCGGSDGGAPSSFDGGVTGNIGPNGGTESNLFFAVVGDTRPATEDDTKNYPTTIITKIFSDLGALKTVPPFVVSTGDYQFSNPYGSESSAQLDLYIKAKGGYPGVQFPAMGNHECTGGTASNCGSGNTNGITNNYSNFMSMMLGPIQKSLPYYSINVAAPNNAWTAKFVFIAANAWDQTQSSWLDTALSATTTYTFVVRHESASANTAPGVSPSETIMAKHPYTLSIVGHSHEYYHSKGSREVVIGNGGAPLATNQNYGYALVAQRSNGSLTVDMIDYQSNQSITSFHFAVNADGSTAPN